MEKAQALSGPWTISAHDPCIINKLTPGTISNKFGETGGTETISFVADCRDEATAKLIAATHDMAEILKAMVYEAQQSGDCMTEEGTPALIKKAITALKKAGLK